MLKNILAITGILLLLLGLFLFFRVRQANNTAAGYDTEWQTAAPIESLCHHLLREATVADRVMSERESQALNIVLVNENSPNPCETTVTLAAPNFDVSPPESNRPVSVPPGSQELTLNWILSPRRTGTYVISISTPTEAITLGITVTTVLGLTAAQAQLLSALSTILGPMLTAPWWYEQWQKRKKEKTAATPPTKPTPPPAEPGYAPE
jgi:hypothetical protein